MTKQEIESLNTMRTRGKTARDISLALGISLNTIRSYIRRHPLEDAVRVECRQCGKPILQVKGRKAKNSVPTDAGTHGGMPTQRRCSGEPITI